MLHTEPYGVYHTSSTHVVDCKIWLHERPCCVRLIRQSTPLSNASDWKYVVNAAEEFYGFFKRSRLRVPWRNINFDSKSFIVAPFSIQLWFQLFCTFNVEVSYANLHAAKEQLAYGLTKASGEKFKQSWWRPINHVSTRQARNCQKAWWALNSAWGETYPFSTSNPTNAFPMPLAPPERHQSVSGC